MSNSFVTPRTVVCQAPLSLFMGFPGKNIRVRHFLLQGFFVTDRWILYHWLSHHTLLIFLRQRPCITGFPGGISGKELTGQCRRCKRHGFDTRVRKIPWRRAWKPTPIFLSGESHGQKSLEGYSPQGCKESFKTEVA